MAVHNYPRKKLSIFTISILLLSLSASWCLAEEAEFTFTNSFDKSEQKAVAYIPESAKNKEAVPLVVVAHFMGGNRYTAKNGGYYPECDARGWLVVCPELHGLRTPGETSLACLGAQHDIIDSIEYMKQHYKVDTSRIYLVGRSMGGMMGGIMAAKYPDVFAAVVAGQGIYDLKLWCDTTIQGLRDAVLKECLPFSETTRFDYERRSAINYAPNFQYVPLILWHGTFDTWVPPGQAEKLTAAIRTFNRFQPDVNWLLNAAHCSQTFTAKWELDQFIYYQNVCEAAFETPTRFTPELNIVTDEAKSFFWMTITPARDTAFSRVKASLTGNALIVKAANTKEVSIELKKIRNDLICSRFEIQSEVPLKLIVTRDGKPVFETTLKKGAFPAGAWKK